MDRRRLATAGPGSGATLVAALALLAAGLLPGCADTDSMPLPPFAPTSSSDWNVLLDPRDGGDINTAWGLDADDMWFAGERGLLMHWNGESMETHTPEDAPTFRGLDGCASDDVWAYGGQYVWRWDGRQWREVMRGRGYYNDIFCEPPDKVALAGHGPRGDLPDGALIHWYDGRGWKTWHGPADASEVDFLWRPVGGGPLVAVVRDSVHHAYRVEDGAWRLLPHWPEVVSDVSGDHLVYRDYSSWNWNRRLGRVEADLTITPLCDAVPSPDLEMSRLPLFRSGGGIYYLAGCREAPILEQSPAGLTLMAVPERPGPDGPAVFAAGEFGLVMQGAWQADWTMQWRQLSGAAARRTDRRLAVTPDRVFTPFVDPDGRGILVGEPRADGSVSWTVEAMDHAVNQLRPVPGGGLLATDPYTWTVRRRDAAGQWRNLDRDTRDNLAGAWSDGGDTVWAMSQEGVFMIHDGQAWTARDELGGACNWFDGRAPDDMVAVVFLRPNGPERVVRFDGNAWTDISPPGYRFSWGRYLAPHSGDLYLDAWFGDDHTVLRRHQGQWAPFAMHDYWWLSVGSHWQETADGELYTRTSAGVLQWTPTSWKLAYPHADSDLDLFAIDPDLGVFAYDYDGRVLHRPYRPR